MHVAGLKSGVALKGSAPFVTSGAPSVLLRGSSHVLSVCTPGTAADAMGVMGVVGVVVRHTGDACAQVLHRIALLRVVTLRVDFDTPVRMGVCSASTASKVLRAAIHCFVRWRTKWSSSAKTRDTLPSASSDAAGADSYPESREKPHELELFHL
eukprot:gene14320-10229_t